MRNATDNQLVKVQKELEEVKGLKKKLTDQKAKLSKDLEESQKRVNRLFYFLYVFEINKSTIF